MSGALRPYPEYKDSGLPWVGKIPAHWDLIRSKYLLREQDRRWKHAKGNLLTVSQYTGVTKRKTREGTSDPDTRASSLVGYKIAEKADLVVNIMLAWNGSFGVVPFDGVVSPAYCVYRFRDGSPSYFHHLLKSPRYLAEIKRRSRGVVESRLRLYTDDLFRIPFVCPPYEEQIKIAGYCRSLDKKINRFIRNRRRLIAVLNEQKQAIINQAVTRGLDPDVRLKPSGVDWIGEIPEHWEVCRLRNVVKSVTSGSRGWSSYAADEGPLFIRITNLSRMSLGFRFGDVVRLKLPDTSEVRRTRIHSGDLLVSITAFIGSIAVVPEGFEEAYVSQHVARCPLRGNQNNSRWIGYVLLSKVGQTHGRLSLYGGTKDGLSLNDVKNYPVFLPPRYEQDELVTNIENSLSKLDLAIKRTNREISLIQEYRTRLIADVVTGQVDVRRLAPAPGGEEELEDPADAVNPTEDESDPENVTDEIGESLDP